MATKGHKRPRPYQRPFANGRNSQLKKKGGGGTIGDLFYNYANNIYKSSRPIHTDEDN